MDNPKGLDGTRRQHADLSAICGPWMRLPFLITTESAVSIMKRKSLRFGLGFRVAFGNERSQAAEMVIAPGDSEGGPANRHHGSDQWLYIVEGQGTAIVNGHRYSLKPGVLMLIEHGDRHEIRATGTSPLRTLNVYVPPGFDAEGDPLPAGKP